MTNMQPWTLYFFLLILLEFYDFLFVFWFQLEQRIIRPFDTISDFSISKLKWCPNHMDYKFKEFSGLAFLSLANRPSEVWPFFHFEFSLPLLWLVDSKFLRKYFSKILNRPIREEIGKIQNSIIKFLSSDFRIWCNLVF